LYAASSACLSGQCNQHVVSVCVQRGVNPVYIYICACVFVCIHMHMFLYTYTVYTYSHKPCMPSCCFSFQTTFNAGQRVDPCVRVYVAICIYIYSIYPLTRALRAFKAPDSRGSPSPRASLGRRTVCGRTEQRRPQGSKRCKTKIRMVWGSFLIAATALKTHEKWL